MENNRTDLYTFKSKKELEDFFSPLFPLSEIRRIYKNESKIFTKRKGNTRYLNRIQLLKKVEWKLSRVLKGEIIHLLLCRKCGGSADFSLYSEGVRAVKQKVIQSYTKLVNFKL